MKTRDILQSAVSFAVGVLIVTTASRHFQPADAASIEPVTGSACDGTGDDETGDVPRDVPRDAPRDVLLVPNYCESFPERCNVPEPCPTKTLDDGSIVSSCVPVDSYVCCEPGVGCYAVPWASSCLHFLYWSECDAGESAIDPVSGEAIIICHD
jgi:hypothetical protein